MFFQPIVRIEFAVDKGFFYLSLHDATNIKFSISVNFRDLSILIAGVLWRFVQFVCVVFETDR